MTIKVIPGGFPRGGFVAAVFVAGVVVADAWGRTRGEAQKAALAAMEVR